MIEPIWNSVTVVGCGLIGASFALAMKRAGACARLAGWDASSSVLDEALTRGIIDEADEAFARGGASTSDLVYLATPVGQIIEFLRARGRQVKPGAVITDAGSTKEEVCRAAREHLPPDRLFVGGHPIAGSHLRGPANARADLFEGMPYLLITGENTSVEHERGHNAQAMLKETIERLGARVELMTAREHDRALALVSHLPQLVSSALMATLREAPHASALEAVSGAGLSDMTRLAASSWTVWRDIVATNPAHIADALDALIFKLAAVRDELRTRDAGAGDKLHITSSLFGARQPATK